MAQGHPRRALERSQNKLMTTSKPVPRPKSRSPRRNPKPKNPLHRTNRPRDKVRPLGRQVGGPAERSNRQTPARPIQPRNQKFPRPLLPFLIQLPPLSAEKQSGPGALERRRQGDLRQAACGRASLPSKATRRNGSRVHAQVSGECGSSPVHAIARARVHGSTRSSVAPASGT